MKLYQFPLSAEQCVDSAYIEETIQKFKDVGWVYNSFVELRSGCVIQFGWPQKTKPVYPEGCEPVVDETPAPAPAGEKKSFFKRLFR